MTDDVTDQALEPHPMIAAPSPTDLQAAVAACYRAFAKHKKPMRPLDICLACCVSEEIDKQLCEWPLKRLSARHFYQYNGSAMSDVQKPGEVGYFLPRMLELLAEGLEIHHSIELSLDRLGRCPAGSWTREEQAALDRYALDYFDTVLCNGLLGEGARRFLDDPLSVLLMFDIGAIAIDPLLNHWLKSDDPLSTIQFVQSTYWDFWQDRDYRNAFASGRPDFRRTIRDWLLDPAHRKQFAAKLLAPSFLTLAETQSPVGNMPFSILVDGVFEQLTQ